MQKFEKLRCPTCNLKNYDIDNENKRGRGGAGVGQRNGKNQQVQSNQRNIAAAALLANDDMNFGSGGSTSAKNQGSNGFSEDPIERKIQARQYRMTMKSQSIINRQLQKLTKQMQYFEGSKDSEGLMIKDFKKI